MQQQDFNWLQYTQSCIDYTAKRLFVRLHWPGITKTDKQDTLTIDIGFKQWCCTLRQNKKVRETLSL